MIENGKARIDRSFNRFRITIPSKKNWFALVFGTAWLGGWYFGFKSAFSSLFSGPIVTGGVDGFLAFWLIGWTVGGFSIVVLLLWGFFGHEGLIISKGELVLKKSVFGIGLRKRLACSEISNIRTEVNNDNWFGGNRWAFWGLGPGKVKFDYGLKTYSFGLGVDDAEAEHLAGILEDRLKK